MITEKELQELVEFKGEGKAVLSLYLNVDSTQRGKDEYKLTLRSLLKEVAGEASSKDVAEVERYFDFEYDWQGKGVALFSCLEDDFWRVYPLAIPVENWVVVADTPYIKPLTDLVDDYGRYGVVMVDREGARLFLFRQGELEEAEGTLGEETKRHKQGGWADSRYQRREDGIAQRNLKEAADLTAQFCEGGRCGRIILGGTEGTVAQFQEMLPRDIQEQVVGSMSVDMMASESEVLDLSLEVIQRVQQQREKDLVERMITAAAKGELGAIGLADTMAAVQEGRAHILVVAEGYRDPGYRCVNCGYTTAQELSECGFCGEEMARTEDAVDAAIHQAVNLGVEVVIVKGNEDLEKAGSIGAILRY